jgi:hypothetical protein
MLEDALLAHAGRTPLPDLRLLRLLLRDALVHDLSILVLQEVISIVERKTILDEHTAASLLASARRRLSAIL